ncbi:MAG: hypothetical protein ACLQF0_01430 [Dissulfurispiraceae bacterium]
MSAFVVSPEHIRELAAFAVSKKHGSMRVDPRYLKYHISETLAAQFNDSMTDDEIATIYAGVLYSENLRSVGERYPDCKGDIDELPGLIEKPSYIVVRMRDIIDRKVRNMIDILKMCKCLEYQSCETDDYYTTDAYKLTQAIKEAAISSLPGYDDAVWEYTRTKQTA